MDEIADMKTNTLTQDMSKISYACRCIAGYALDRVHVVDAENLLLFGLGYIPR